jgi:hypothetical protein
MKRLLLAAALLASISGARAFHPRGVAGASSPFGPGSPGFLSTCSSTFSITNNVLQSQAFTTSPWVTNGTVVSAPTITANSTTAPDSTTTASTLALPAVSGTGARSFVYQQITSLFTPYSYTADVYVKGVAGGETIWLTIANGASFAETKVIATTSWQRVSVTWPVGAGNQFLEIGVDLTDGTQTPTAAQSVYIWGAQLAGGSAEWPYIPTTSAAVTQTPAVNCPASVAFRDFSTLTYYSGNPITPQNTAVYNAGGTANPFMRPWSKIGATYYAMTNCTVAGANRATWPYQCLYTGSGPDAWTDYAAGNPVITTSAGTWRDHYMLHGAIAPSGTCSYDTWCYYVSAMDASNHSSIGVFSSPDQHTWTDHGQLTLAGVSDPSLPSVIQIGSLLYLYSSINDNAGAYLVYWTSPVGNGTASGWTFRGTALNPTLATDWDGLSGVNEIGVIDTHVFLNSHGFYELAYTALINGGAAQKIGYAVSNDGKTWWKYQAAPILVSNTPAYPGTIPYIGDVFFFQDGTNFHMLFNYDDAISLSAGVDSIMVDH